MKLFLIILLILVLINLYFRYKTFKNLDKDLEKVKWKNLPKEKYMKKCYDFVADRFAKVRHCWLKFPWRNIYYRNMWRLKDKGIPCHMYTPFFNRCLLKRFKKKEVKTAVTSNWHKKMMIHFYSKVKINGGWINIDVWGKKRGIPLGKNIHNSKIY